MGEVKVVVFTKPGVPLKIREEASPDPAPDELFVQVEIAGVCGSDAHRLSEDQVLLPEPNCFGHEGVGADLISF